MMISRSVVCFDIFKLLVCLFVNAIKHSSIFQACTFLEWVDKRPLQELDILKTQVETKMRYRIRLEEAREAARLARVEQERRVHQQELRVKGKEAQLKHRREKLSEQEAALQMQEEEYKDRQAQLRKQEEEERKKFKEHGQSSSSDPRKGKGKAKFIHYTQ